MIASSLDVYVVDSQVSGLVGAIPSVVVHPNTKAARQAEIDVPQVDVIHISEEHAVVGRAGDAKVGDLDVGAVARVDGCHVSGTRSGHVDGAAHIEHGVAREADAFIGTHKTIALPQDALLAVAS